MITTIMGVIIVIIILALLMILVLKWPTSIHNMILMSRYKGQLHGGKKGPKKAPPPLHAHTHPNRAMPERIFFSYVRCSQSAPVSLPFV